jgi:alpha-L-fucosidase
MAFYPEVVGPVSEYWHAGKWTETQDFSDYMPMWADFDKSAHRHYFVKELARTYSGEYVLLARWITMKSVVHAEVYLIEKNNDVCPRISRRFSLTCISLDWRVCASECNEAYSGVRVAIQHSGSAVCRHSDTVSR